MLGCNHLLDQRRDPFWDNAKGILILLVVAGHILERCFDPLPINKLLWTFIYAFHMPTFILISGYMASRSSKDPVDRIPKLLWYYTLAQTGFAAINWLTGETAGFELNWVKPGFGAWYLLSLSWFYLAAHFLRDKPKKTVLIITFTLALLRGFDTTLNNTAGLIRFVSFLPVFLMGYYFDLAAVVDKLRLKKPLCGAVFGAVEAVLIAAVRLKILNRKQFTGHRSYDYLYEQQLWRGLLLQPVCFLASIVLALCFLALVSRKRSVLTYIGQNSLMIYLFHIVIVVKTFNLFSNHLLDGTTPQGAFYSMLLTFAVIAVMMLGLDLLRNCYHRLRSNHMPRG